MTNASKSGIATDKFSTAAKVDEPTLRRIPIYEVRLVKTRRALRVAESVATNPECAAHALHSLLAHTDREHFVALFLGNQNDITGMHVVAIGGQDHAPIDTRTVFRAAIAACAARVIVGHNHPGGEPKPSRPDFELTKALSAAGEILGIPVVDHIIVTRHANRWYSMAKSGTLPQA